MAGTPSGTPDPEGTGSDNSARRAALFSELLAQAYDAVQGELRSKESNLRRYETRPNAARVASSRRRASDSDLTSLARDADHPFGQDPVQLEVRQDGFQTKASVTSDGRVGISISQANRSLSSLLVPTIQSQLDAATTDASQPVRHEFIPPALGGLPGQQPPPRLNVVIHVVGSRGDVQPFVALGRTLRLTYGHRVRLATHPVFKDFVEENGLEFFSISGDPAGLMAFMVKNPGLMPGFDSLKSGDVGKRRKEIEGILLGCWRSCIEAGDGMTQAPETSTSITAQVVDEADVPYSSQRPFIADAIIANPPSFAHIHIAEKLGIPLHLMFTMPWSPTQAFPHPLANIQASDAEDALTNFVSYALVEMMTWQGLGDVINRFRQKALALDPVSLIWAPGILNRLKIPWTYCWSPALIPKPADWGGHISVAGFYFLPLASSFTPDTALTAFLEAGPAPVYIGFGSIVVDDPNALTKLILDAIRSLGVRALVSKGWGGIGADALDVPLGVYMLGNVPHDWLFEKVSCVVHHGGAGTAAAGIAAGKPTVVIPFFGDQFFWGSMIARAGAGPPPIPHKQLTADKLAVAIREALKPETLVRASQLKDRIQKEKGTESGGQSFHDQLDMSNLRCSMCPNRVAVWRIRRTKIKLSALAANVLASNKLLRFSDLKLYRSIEYSTEEGYGPWDPISGGASALLGTLGSLTMGVADFPMELFKSVRRRADSRLSNQDVSAEASAKELKSRPNSSLSLPPPDLEMTTPPSPSKGSATSTGSGSPTGARRSLREALRRGSDHGSFSRSRTRSLEGQSSPPLKLKKQVEPSKLTLQSSIGAGKSIARVVGAGLKSPMDFTVGIARGFHNAPKLYGDDTVRQQQKVTDFQSGLVAAGKTFGYGFYDGITGLVTQPYRGAEKEGAAGFIKGFGKGLAGVVLKPGAGIWGLPGYASLGVHREIRKLFESDATSHIIAARTTQGFEDASQASNEEQDDILAKWHDYADEYQRTRQRVCGGDRPPPFRAAG